MDASTLGRMLDHYNNGDISPKDAMEMFCVLQNKGILPSMDASYNREFHEFLQMKDIIWDWDNHQWIVAPEVDEI